MVFDIGNLHVKGRETGRERKGGEGEEREGSSLP